MARSVHFIGLLKIFMDKKTFIQQTVIHYRCKPEQVDAAIDYAEGVWDLLTARGYGTSRDANDRSIKNYYAMLLPDQKDMFDKFWRAFRKKDGKQRAVKAWMKINPTSELFLSIFRGAEHEARMRNDRGTTPPYAELWLNERRWEDAPVERKESEREALDNGYAHAKQMHELFSGQGQENMASFWKKEMDKYSQ